MRARRPRESIRRNALRFSALRLLFLGVPTRGARRAGRRWPHLPAVGAEAPRLLEFADLALLKMPGAKVTRASGSPTPPAL